MADHRLPKIVFYGELATGCRKRRAPKRRYKDSLKQHLSLGHNDHHQWSTLASNCGIWRHTTHNAAASFESTHRISLEEKRQRRKNRASTVPPKETFRCALCNWSCLSRIGLSATSALAVSVGKALPKSSSTKPSHDDDIQIGETCLLDCYCGLCTESCTTILFASVKRLVCSWPCHSQPALLLSLIYSYRDRVRMPQAARPRSVQGRSFADWSGRYFPSCGNPSTQMHQRKPKRN